MNLINVDDLEKELNMYNYHLTYGDCIYELRKAPLVNAITVEWIENWCNKSENTYSKADVIKMLNDWEKENEIN